MRAEDVFQMPNNKPGSRLIKAAGGVAWRQGPDGEPEILLVHRKKYDDWSLPKGKNEPGEPLPVTAVREVLEEGGARLALGRRLISVRYNVGGRPKRVHYWAARVLSVDERAVPNPEVDEIAWVPAARAVERVSYVHDHGVLADFTARPAGTVPLILLRHSKALAKGAWKRSDAVRPLDDSGRSDAKALADLLACFAPRPRLISSPALRCADTLRPLSDLTGAPVRVEPALYIHHDSSRTSAAYSSTPITALVREAIASGEPTVICAHRENLPALQDAALAALAGHPAAEIPASELPGGAADGVAGGPIAALPREWDDTLPTSGFWVLNVAPQPPQPGQAQVITAAPDPAVADPAAPDRPDAGAPARGRRWWQRLRVRPSQHSAPRPADDVTSAAATGAAATGAEVAGGELPGGNADGSLAGGSPAVSGEIRDGEADNGSTDRPVGVLISADYYDLSEP
jgi:8-oxo-dGTP pyrophosphatase MutT (NUDIX family)/phosphohistidine phosphatase SixA